MCFDSLFGGSKSADQANQLSQQQLRLQQQQTDALNAQNATKQANITAGQAAIDKNFSQFDPAYYDKLSKAYTTNYDTQLADQYTQAKDTEEGRLASQGILGSSAGNAELANLAKTNADQIGQVANQATDAVNAQKGKISAAQTNLTSLNQAGGDPNTIATNAAGSAGSLVAPQSFTPLGNVFSSLLTPTASYLKAGINGYANPSAVGGVTGGAPVSGGGSSSVSG